MVRPPAEASNKVRFADLKIQTKGSKGKPPALVPFTPNAIQREYLNEIWPDWQTGTNIPRGLQEIILKSRQFGFSTLIAALFFLDTINHPNTTTVVVAHKGSAAENLFRIVHRFWRHLPADKRPRKDYSSKRELSFPDLDSRYLVFTAGGEGAAASYTIHNLHCSEAALYPPTTDFWTTITPAIPEGGNIFQESTARGESGTGKTFCLLYREAAGQIDPPEDTDRTLYTARFYAWWQHSEYELEPKPGFVRTDAETSIANKYALDALYGQARTDAKLQWRRVQIAKPGMGNLFAQEFPGDDVEAFLVSGSRYFTEWDEARHCIWPDAVTIERHWHFFGAYDWGYKPSYACFLLGCVDDRGRVIVIDEIYQQEKTDPEQAADVLALLKARNLDPSEVPIYADPNMWAHKTDWIGKKVQNVSAFTSIGLRMVAAAGGPGSRVPRWMNVRRYLHDVDTDPDGKRTPLLRVFRGRVPNLIRIMPLMIHDKIHPDDMETDPKLVEDHAADTLANLLGARPRPSGPAPEDDPGAPPPPGTPDNRPAWMKKKKVVRKL